MTTMELDARKLRLVRDILNVEDVYIIDKLQRSFNRQVAKLSASADTEYISKEEILAGIGQGLKEMQERKRSGKKAMTLDELIDEL